MSKQAVPQASGFTLLLMRAGHMAAIGFAILALLTFVGAMLYVGSRSGDSFKTPSFSKMQEEGELLRFSREESQAAAQEEIEQLNKQFREDIYEVIKTNGITQFTTDDIIRTLSNVPENRRSQWVKGWAAFLEDGMEHFKKSGTATPETATRLSNFYAGNFSRAIAKAEDAKVMAQAERISGISVGLGALIAFIVALLIPVLVQIERNTRAVRFALEGAPEEPAPAATKTKPVSSKAVEPTSVAPVAASTHVEAAATTPAETAPQPAAATAEAHCPQCATPHETEATFCGECGHKLATA
ncbi:zinc ribbon domain-containing protein [Chitinilyticum piscinae]|uniref:Zinc ribbon domain-containing protein n=1 Tax=Chitinilyticum piscinae TaxID=2866724 RepID=A0A8J7FFG2_9NEIS|nr:zinc ribbon domain-containing protein [Chitinilyticum piscinae]MBE9608403.1 zinc ribbon domain-containing protein [Chitinilyticum piscinae]